MGDANKIELHGTNEGKMGETNIKARVWLGEAHKSETGKANIEAGTKSGARAVPNTDNNADGGGKLTNWHAEFAGFALAALATANCDGNSNLAISKETFLRIAISTPNKILATFAGFANTTFEKKPKVCKSNPFLFAVNHQ